MARSDRSSLSPSDGAVTLRSLPRRYREAFAGDDRRARAGIVGANGVSALDLLDNTVGTLALLERALHQIDASDQPVLHAGVLDPAEREFASATSSVDEALDRLDTVATTFASRVDAVSADAWLRTGKVVTTGAAPDSTHEVTALEMLQEAAATATDNLRAADQLLAPPEP